MAVTSTTTLSEAIMEYHERNLLDMLMPSLVLYEDAVKKPLPKDHGLTIKFMRYQQFGGPELLTEGTAPTAAALSAENVSTKIFQLGKHTVLTDLVEETTIDESVKNATMVLSLAARKAVDSAIGRCILWRRTALSATLGIGAGAGFGLSAVGQLSSTQFEIPLIRNGTGNCNILALSGIHSSSTLTVTLLRQARKHLEGRDCPTFPDGTYHAVTHPDALNVLQASSAWIDLNKYTNIKPLTGEAGKIQNIRFKTSTNMPVATASGHPVSTYGGNTVHFTYVYGANAYGVTEISTMRGGKDGAQLILKTSGRQTTNDPLNQQPHTLGYKYTGACKVLNVSCIIGILTGKGDDSLVAA
jgi:N4-gp56 family major capsid protein